ncbi:MAG: type III pantothenate kinase [Actinomycetota bacterium]|nr:type III pantothenate kinase [Actinomycetota bacterium]
MLLAIDVGNTETVVGVFRDHELAARWRIHTSPERTADELALVFGGFLGQEGLSFDKNVTGVILSSVVPNATQQLREMVNRYFPFDAVVVEPGIKTGVPVLTDNPREVGADRIVNALAAFTKYGGPAIVVDFGTATTFDVVSGKGELLGAVIAPGLQVAAKSLFEQTARLPLVELVAPKSPVGKNTVESVQSGLVFGYASMVDGMVDRISDELGEATVIATGGLAPMVIEECRSVDHHDPWLTLDGLRLVFDRNAE